MHRPAGHQSHFVSTDVCLALVRLQCPFEDCIHKSLLLVENGNIIGGGWDVEGIEDINDTLGTSLRSGRSLPGVPLLLILVDRMTTIQSELRELFIPGSSF